MSRSISRRLACLAPTLKSLIAIRWTSVDLRAACRSSWKYGVSIYFSILYLLRDHTPRADGGDVDGFDILTIVFGEEVELLRLQARSFDRFLGEDFAGEIVVVVNDLQPGKVARRIRAEVLPDYGRWRDRVRILPFHALAYRLDPANGWIIQQVLKLAYAGICARPWYITFDAKNHLIAPVSHRTFLAADGRARQPFQRAAVSLPQHEAACAAYFGLAQSGEGRPQFLPMTPFVLHTPTVERMVQHIEAREGTRLADFFCDRRLVSEFLLYGLYVHAFAGGLDKRYCDTAPRAVTLWTDSGPLAAALARSADADVVCFGVHRHRLAMLAAPGVAALEAFWEARGLLAPGERFGAMPPGSGPHCDHRCEPIERDPTRRSAQVHEPPLIR